MDESAKVDLRRQIGPWSEVKLDIVRKYANAYSTILGAQKNPSLHHSYIDAFAGAGSWISRLSGQPVAGSPVNALATDPPFRSYFFIDIDKLRVAELEHIAGSRSDVLVYHGDANQMLVEKVLPQVRYENYRRALCLLDPYGMDYQWSVVESIGKMRSIDLFLNFPIMDINRNVLRRDPMEIDPRQEARMTSFWGDSSWRHAIYAPSLQLDMFRDNVEVKAYSNRQVVDEYIRRLRTSAGFTYIPEPMPMRNSANSDVYYLIFAAHKQVAGNIVEQIFDKYR